jgi:prepilin-type N-terminal cleavage/methylation domain-containing protein
MGIKRARGFSLIEALLVLTIGGIVMAIIFGTMARHAKDEALDLAALQTAQDAARFARAVREYDYYTQRGNRTVIDHRDLENSNLLPRRSDGRRTDEDIFATGQDFEALIIAEAGEDLVLVYPKGRIDPERARKFDMVGNFGQQTIFMTKVAGHLNHRFPAPNTVAGVVDRNDRILRGPYGSFEMNIGGYLDRRNEPFWVLLMTLPKG